MAVDRSEATTTQAFAGNLALGARTAGNREDQEDAKQVCEPTICGYVHEPGAIAKSVLVGRAHADLTIKAINIVPCGAHTADANSPDIGLSKSSTAAGSLTVLGTPKDGTSGNYVDRTPIAVTIAESSVSSGDYLWLTVATNGTPADIACALVLEVEYELAN